MMNRNVVVVLSIVAVVIVLGILYIAFSSAASVPVVHAGDTVGVIYTGSFTNGTVFNSNVGGQPLVFTADSGQLIAGFDQAVIGMKLNQTKNVTIPVNEAYGPVNTSLILQVPLSVFGNNTVQVGSSVTENQNGQDRVGRVIAVNATDATVDFNSPLAGQTLVFQIKVVEIESNSTAGQIQDS